MAKKTTQSSGWGKGQFTKTQTTPAPKGSGYGVRTASDRAAENAKKRKKIN